MALRPSISDDRCQLFESRHLRAYAPFSGGIAHSLEILLEVHAGIERRNLVVTVEHQGRTPEEFSQSSLLGLAPARMIHVGIHIGIESVFVRSGQVPGGCRLFFHQLDFARST